jgi:hypothetical protein
MLSLRRAYAVGLLLLALGFAAVWLAGIRQVEPLAIGVAAVVIVYGAFREGVRAGNRGPRGERPG